MGKNTGDKIAGGTGAADPQWPPVPLIDTETARRLGSSIV
jgi:hypothetical protein